MLDILVKKKIGTLDMDIGFSVERPLITVVFGRSGSGKTTLANMLAGLVCPDKGRIRFENSVYTDTEAGVNLSPEKRGIGYVFQEHRLFPHLNVKDNLTFGKFPGGRRSKADFSKIVDLLHIGHLMKRSPDTLSGGEAQRVAIGRALFACTSFLIMDEPLSSLDSRLKDAHSDAFGQLNLEGILTYFADSTEEPADRNNLITAPNAADKVIVLFLTFTLGTDYKEVKNKYKNS